MQCRHRRKATKSRKKTREMGRRECKRRKRRKKTSFLGEKVLVAEKLWTDSKLISNKQFKIF